MGVKQLRGETAGSARFVGTMEGIRLRGRARSGHQLPPRGRISSAGGPAARFAGMPRIKQAVKACERLVAQDLILGMPDDMWTPERQRAENAAVDGRKDNMNK
jgi:hypothetical protein